MVRDVLKEVCGCGCGCGCGRECEKLTDWEFVGLWLLLGAVDSEGCTDVVGIAEGMPLSEGCKLGSSLSLGAVDGAKLPEGDAEGTLLSEGGAEGSVDGSTEKLGRDDVEGACDIVGL